MSPAATVLALNHLADAWLASAATGLLTVIVLGSLCVSINRFLSPALRCWLWWLICARLVFGAIGGLLGFPQIPVPVSLPTFVQPARMPAATSSIPTGAVRAQMADAAETGRLPDDTDTIVPGEPHSLDAARPSAISCLFLLWSLGAAASLGCVVCESLRLHRSLRAADDLSATALGSDMREIAARMGIASPPRIVEVSGVSSPFVAGWRRPALVLPHGLDAALSRDEMQMALAHELAHLCRGDLYLTVIPMVTRAVCFCIPIVPSFACSEWATAREADCDARAMKATAAAPGAYSQVLIKIIRGDIEAHRTPLFTLGATASFHTLRARLQLIRESSKRRRLGPAGFVVFVLAAACVILPWRAGRTTESLTLAPLAPLPTPDGAGDVADVTAFATCAGNDPNKRYILIGGRTDTVPPAHGYRLLIVLPGGDGGADFSYFIRRVQKQALGERYLVAELIAKQWDPRQAAAIVWPTRANPWPSMRFSTEEFAASVVNDVEARFPINRRKVFALSWASGGPAGYALSLAPATPIKGSFVAMSTFTPDAIPPLAAARGHAYYLLHPEDAPMAPLSMAEEARNQLRHNGAAVELATYAGGYGWSGDVYGQVRRGMQFLEDHTVP